MHFINRKWQWFTFFDDLKSISKRNPVKKYFSNNVDGISDSSLLKKNQHNWVHFMKVSIALFGHVSSPVFFSFVYSTHVCFFLSTFLFYVCNFLHFFSHNFFLFTALPHTNCVLTMCMLVTVWVCGCVWFFAFSVQDKPIKW